MTVVPVAPFAVEMGMPEGAIALPVQEDGDLTAWAGSTARARLRPGTPDETVAAFAVYLLEATADARGRNPLCAFAFCPNPDMGELARVEVRAIAAEPGAPDLTPKDFAAFFGGLTATSVDEPEVVYGDLPIGPAARIRHRYLIGPDLESGPDDVGDAFQEGLSEIQQSLIYATCPPGLGSAVVMFMSWRALAFSDRLFELGDELAATLSVRDADETDDPDHAGSQEQSS